MLDSNYMGRGGSSETSSVLSRRLTFPQREIPRLAHLGTMVATDKGKRSYEGHGLSVSLDPDAWSEIAKLGGLPLWELEKADGVFIEAHSLTEDQKDIITEWGIKSGLVETAISYQTTRWDDELDGEYCGLYSTYQEAYAEAETDESPEDMIKTVVTLKPLAALEQRLGMKSELDCFDHLLVVYAEDETEADEVWWEDAYGFMSAPRGVILPSRLESWSHHPISQFEE